MIWLLGFCAVCACFAIVAAIRALRGGGMYVAGQKVSGLTIILAATIIVIAWGLFAATQLGFIANHAP